jgi:hypothetical protein
MWHAVLELAERIQNSLAQLPIRDARFQDSYWFSNYEDAGSCPKVGLNKNASLSAKGSHETTWTHAGKASNDSVNSDDPDGHSALLSLSRQFGDGFGLFDCQRRSLNDELQ